MYEYQPHLYLKLEKVDIKVTLHVQLRRCLHVATCKHFLCNQKALLVADYRCLPESLNIPVSKSLIGAKLLIKLTPKDLTATIGAKSVL